MLHSDLARDFLPLSLGVIRLDEDIVLAQVLFHGQVLRDACRDTGWRDKLQHFLELFLLFLLLQLQGHSVLILSFNKKLLVTLNPI